MERYFTRWNAGAFDELQALFADDATFRGPLGTAEGPEALREGLQNIAAMSTDRKVVTMLAQGADVITWFELHTETAEPVPVANWAKVQDGKIQRVRVAFDPRPLLT
jgi:ketosteroid isomerase-like protein